MGKEMLEIKTPNNGKKTVANTTTVILALNVKRAWVVICNDSDETVYIGLSADAVSGEGYRLDAAGNPGAKFVMDANSIYKGAINGICASGGKSVSFIEGEHE